MAEEDTLRRMRRALLFILLCAPALAFAARPTRVTVPVDVGVGPAGYFIFGPVLRDSWPLPHWGLKLNVEAVIDQATIRKNQRSIPPRYRRLASRITELRIPASIFIPDALIISPKVKDTGIYGVTWRPLSLGVPLAGSAPREGGPRRFSLGLSAGLLLTYMFLHSDTLPTTHFLRPGLDVELSAEVALSHSFLVSFGWAHQLYVPQALGGFGFGPLDSSIFHVGQPFLKLHFRFPFSTTL